MKNLSFSRFLKTFVTLALLVGIGVVPKPSHAQPDQPGKHAYYTVDHSYLKPDNGKRILLEGEETSATVSFRGYAYVTSDWAYDVSARAIVLRINPADNTAFVAAVGNESLQHIEPNQTASMYSASYGDFEPGDYYTVFTVGAELTDVPAGTDPYSTEDPVQIENAFAVGG